MLNVYISLPLICVGVLGSEHYGILPVCGLVLYHILTLWYVGCHLTKSEKQHVRL